MLSFLQRYTAPGISLANGPLSAQIFQSAPDNLRLNTQPCRLAMQNPTNRYPLCQHNLLLKCFPVNRLSKFPINCERLWINNIIADFFTLNWALTEKLKENQN